MREYVHKLSAVFKVAFTKVARIFVSKKLPFRKLSKRQVKYLLYIVPLGMFIPFSFAYANVFTDIKNTIINVLDIILGLGFFFIGFGWLKLLLIFGGLLGFLPVALGAVVFKAVAGNAIIKLPYTSGGIVDIGWLITRDIANMVLILVLVVIAISTILGNERRGVRALLPRLIFVALLINFTKVITGVVVDMSNIVTNYFLSPVTNFGNLLINIFWKSGPIYQVWQDGVKLFKNFTLTFDWIVQLFDAIGANFSLSALIGDVITTLMIWLISILLMVALFAFAFVFFIRYIAIWLLVIVSPLAFVALILPDTQKYATMWWNKFIKWSFIGVIPSFLIFLTAKILEMKNDPTAFGAIGQLIPTQLGGFAASMFANTNSIMSEFLYWLVILIFMFMGLSAALKMNSKMASITVKWGKKGMGAVTGFAKRKAWEKYGQVAATGVRAAGEKAGRALPGPFGGMARGAARGAEVAMRKKASENVQREKKAAREIENEKDFYDDLAFALQHNQAPARQIGLLSDALRREGGDYKRIERELDARGFNPANLKTKFESMGKQASLYNEERPFEQARPDLFYPYTPGTPIDPNKERLLKSLKEEQWKNMATEAFADKDVQEHLYKSPSISGRALAGGPAPNATDPDDVAKIGLLIQNPAAGKRVLSESMSRALGDPATAPARLTAENDTWKAHIDGQIMAAPGGPPPGPITKTMRVQWLRDHGRNDLYDFFRRTTLANNIGIDFLS